jgi:hypothetical protein
VRGLGVLGALIRDVKARLWVGIVMVGGVGCQLVVMLDVDGMIDFVEWLTIRLNAFS